MVLTAHYHHVDVSVGEFAATHAVLAAPITQVVAPAAQTGEMAPPVSRQSCGEALHLDMARRGGPAVRVSLTEGVSFNKDVTYLRGLQLAMAARLERGTTGPVRPLALRAVAVGMRFRALHTLLAPRADAMITTMAGHDYQQRRADSVAVDRELSLHGAHSGNFSLLRGMGAEAPSDEYAATVQDTWRFIRLRADSQAPADATAIEAHMEASGIPIPGTADSLLQ